MTMKKYPGATKGRGQKVAVHVVVPAATVRALRQRAKTHHVGLSTIVRAALAESLSAEVVRLPRAMWERMLGYLEAAKVVTEQNAQGGSHMEAFAARDLTRMMAALYSDLKAQRIAGLTADVE